MLNVNHVTLPEFHQITSQLLVNFGVTQSMLGINIKQKTMLGGYSVFKNHSNFMITCVSTTSKVSLTSGKFLVEMKLLKMVNGFLDLVMTSSKWSKKNWVILKSLPKTLVTLMIRHVNFLQTVVTLE